MNYTRDKWIAAVVAIVVILIFFGGLFAYRSQQNNADLINTNTTSTNVNDTNDNNANATGTSNVSGTTHTTADGLVIQDSVVGTGATATAGHSVTVNYTGTLTDGTVFDSSYTRGQPFTFQLGAGQVIQGWDEGVAGMKVGGKRRLTIPSTLGYGAQGAGGVIPPNATLIFDVELVSVQ